MAMPRRASAGGSSRRPTRLRAPSASPTTRARAAAAIRESIRQATARCLAGEPGDQTQTTRLALRHQRYDLRREVLHRGERFGERGPGEVEQQVAHTQRAERSDVACDVGIAAGERSPLPVVELERLTRFVPCGPVAQADAVRVALRAFGVLAQAGDRLRIA